MAKRIQRFSNIRKCNERLILSPLCPRLQRDVLVIPSLCPRSHFLQELLLCRMGMTSPTTLHRACMHLELCLHEKRLSPIAATVFLPFSIISGSGRKLPVTSSVSVSLHVLKVRNSGTLECYKTCYFSFCL